MRSKLFNWYVFFLLAYAIFTAVSLSQGKTWVFDGIFALFLITTAYIFSKQFKINVTEFFLINIGMILHLLGFFGAYGITAKYIAYDNLVHLVNGAFAAYILFNFVIKTIDMRKHKALLLFLVIASTIAICVSIEMMEFAGFIYLGHGDGLFFVGSGDSKGPTIYGNYIDAMDDIAFDIVGSFIGAFVYYRWKYKGIMQKTK